MHIKQAYSDVIVAGIMAVGLTAGGTVTNFQPYIMREKRESFLAVLE